jgi:hypothetical protein
MSKRRRNRPPKRQRTPTGGNGHPASTVSDARTESNGALLTAARQRTLSEVFTDYDIINVSPEGFIVASEKLRAYDKDDRAPDFRQLGTSGQTSYGWGRDEYNPKLRDKAGYRVYDEMRRSDGQVRSTLRLIKTPVIGGRWYIQAASREEKDVEVADFVWKCLTEYMSIPFRQVLYDALTMLDFGASPFEKVFEEREIEGKTRVIWQKLMPLHIDDVEEIKYDRNGGPDKIRFYRERPGESAQFVDIDIEKLCVFTHDRECGNIMGISILRSAYKHWYYKSNLEKIDAIQKERHGIGVPIIKLPIGFTSKGPGNDVLLADEIGRNLRVNESAHVVLPPLWELEFAKLEGQPVDSIASIAYHNQMILANILAPWFEGNQNTDVSVLHDLFLKASRFVADTIADGITCYVIPQLVNYNYERGSVGYPKLKVRRIGETTDWRTFSFAIRNLVGADLLRADLPLEEYLRDEMDLPLYDEATDRKQEEIERQEEQAELAHSRAMEINKTRQAQQGQPGAGGKKQDGQKAGLPRQAKPKASVGGSRTGGPSNNSQGK